MSGVEPVLCARLATFDFAVALESVAAISQLGPVTPLPRVPSPIAGVAVVAGQIVPVLHGAALFQRSDPDSWRSGMPALLLQHESLHALIPVVSIVETSSGSVHGTSCTLPNGRALAFLHVRDLFASLEQRMHSIREARYG